MKRKALLKKLASAILKKRKDSPLLVGIDGVGASGKTTLAKELADELKTSERHVIQASVDDFHNPKKIRYAKGENSPEGYYFDSFDYGVMADVLLDPIGFGDLQYKTAVFDHIADSKVSLPFQTAKADSILIMEGIFLFRPELGKYWDYKIFIDVDFEITVRRAVQRSRERQETFNEEEILDKYKRRYIPAQQIYFEQVHPKEKADIVVEI